MPPSPTIHTRALSPITIDTGLERINTYKSSSSYPKPIPDSTNNSADRFASSGDNQHEFKFDRTPPSKVHIHHDSSSWHDGTPNKHDPSPRTSAVLHPNNSQDRESVRQRGRDLVKEIREMKDLIQKDVRSIASWNIPGQSPSIRKQVSRSRSPTNRTYASVDHADISRKLFPTENNIENDYRRKREEDFRGRHDKIERHQNMMRSHRSRSADRSSSFARNEYNDLYESSRRGRSRSPGRDRSPYDSKEDFRTKARRSRSMDRSQLRHPDREFDFRSKSSIEQSQVRPSAGVISNFSSGSRSTHKSDIRYEYSHSQARPNIHRGVPRSIDRKGSNTSMHSDGSLYMYSSPEKRVGRSTQEYPDIVSPPSRTYSHTEEGNSSNHSATINHHRMPHPRPMATEFNPRPDPNLVRPPPSNSPATPWNQRSPHQINHLNHGPSPNRSSPMSTPQPVYHHNGRTGPIQNSPRHPPTHAMTNPSPRPTQPNNPSPRHVSPAGRNMNHPQPSPVHIRQPHGPISNAPRQHPSPMQGRPSPRPLPPSQYSPMAPNRPIPNHPLQPTPIRSNNMPPTPQVRPPSAPRPMPAQQHHQHQHPGMNRPGNGVMQRSPGPPPGVRLMRPSTGPPPPTPVRPNPPPPPRKQMSHNMPSPGPPVPVIPQRAIPPRPPPVQHLQVPLESTTVGSFTTKYNDTTLGDETSYASDHSEDETSSFDQSRGRKRKRFPKCYRDSPFWLRMVFNCSCFLCIVAFLLVGALGIFWAAEGEISLFGLSQTAAPTFSPAPSTSHPTFRPTKRPTPSPTPRPTPLPTIQASQRPSNKPSLPVPSSVPSTSFPSHKPSTSFPSPIPSTSSPTLLPTLVRSHSPSTEPSTSHPTARPSEKPTVSFSPTGSPPTSRPTVGDSVTFFVTGGFYARNDLFFEFGTAAIDVEFQRMQREGSRFLIHLGDFNDPGITNCAEPSFSTLERVLTEGSNVPVFTVNGANDYINCPNPFQAFTYWNQYFSSLERNWNLNGYNVERMDEHVENFAFVQKRVLFIGIDLVVGEVNTITNRAERDFFNFQWIRDQVTEKFDSVSDLVIFGNGKIKDDKDWNNQNIHTQFFRRVIEDVIDYAMIRTLYVHPTTSDSWEVSRPFDSPFLTVVNVQESHFPFMKITVDPDGRITYFYDQPS